MGGGRGGSGVGVRLRGGEGVWVDVIEELKFLGKFKKKWGGGGWGVGFVRGGGFRADVNEELDVL